MEQVRKQVDRCVAGRPMMLPPLPTTSNLTTITTSTEPQEKARLRAEDASLLASVNPGVPGVDKALAALLDACGGDRKVQDS